LADFDLTRPQPSHLEFFGHNGRFQGEGFFNLGGCR